MRIETTRASRSRAGLSLAVLLFAVLGLSLGCGRPAEEEGEEPAAGAPETGEENGAPEDAAVPTGASIVEVKPCTDGNCSECMMSGYEKLDVDHPLLTIHCEDFEPAQGNRRCIQQDAVIVWRLMELQNVSYDVTIQLVPEKASGTGQVCNGLYEVVDTERNGPSITVVRRPGDCSSYPASWPYEIVVEAKDPNATSYCADPEIIIVDDSAPSGKPGGTGS